MTYYIFIENDKINGSGECPVVSDNTEIINYEVSENLYNDFNADADRYMWNGKTIVENPDYEEIKRQKEKQELHQQLLIQIEELDKKRIRAICEPSIKDETTGETWLEYYNTQISDLRKQLEV